MKTLTQDELNEILDAHELWMKTGGEKGKRDDLSLAAQLPNYSFKKLVFTGESK
jgi:hypothetical protein